MLSIPQAKTAADYLKVFPSDGYTRQVEGRSLVLVGIRNMKYIGEWYNSTDTLIVLDDLDAVETWNDGIGTYGFPVEKVNIDDENFIQKIQNPGKKIVCVAITGQYDWRLPEKKAREKHEKEFDAGVENFKKKVEGYVKFDWVIGNPPYDGTLHLDIHEKFQKLVNPGGGIIWIHPNRVVIDHRDWGDYTIGKKHESFRDGLTNIHMFQGNNIFNIDNQTPLMVSVWRKDVADKKELHDIEVIDNFYGNGTYVADAHHISKYGRLTKQLEDFFGIAKGKDNLTKHAKGQKDKPTAGYVCGFSGILGHITENTVSPDFYSIVRPNQSCYLEDMEKEDEKKLKRLEEKGEDTSDFKKMEDRYSIWFGFGTSIERENFIKYLKTKTVRFLLSFLKDDKNFDKKMLQKIPWVDFTRSYSDKELCELWNIDDKMWKYIDSYIPAFYNDYHFDGFYEDETSKKLKSKVDELVDDAE